MALLLAIYQFFLLFWVAHLQFSLSVVLHVNSISGNDSRCGEAISTEHLGLVSNLPCQTIEHAYNLTKNMSNVQIKIESNATLSMVLEYWKVQNISVTGMPDSNSYEWIDLTCEGEAGMLVSDVETFLMANLSLVNCSNDNQTRGYRAGVIIQWSSQITLSKMTISKSQYSGLLLLNCYGNICLNEVTFTNNKYYEFRNLKRNSSEEMKFSTETNYSSDSIGVGNYPYVFGYSERKVGKVGGGLNIVLDNNRCCHGNFVIEKCRFIGNAATWGGGLHISINGDAADNVIFVTSSTFHGNKATKEGGGLRINIRSSSKEVYLNQLTFENSNFTANRAKYGGGVGIQSTYNSIHKFEAKNIVFKNCAWTDNSAFITSPAIDIASFARQNSERYGFLPVVHFENIAVVNNTVLFPNKLMSSIIENSGVFLITQMKVIFIGTICFDRNFPTALKAVSGGVMIDNGTTLVFENNTGTNGAAVALYGFSYIHLSDNIFISFTNNKAEGIGAAIYHHGIDEHNLFVGTYCFLERNNKAPHNVTLHFQNNQAENDVWIYAESFLSCAFRCNPHINTNELIFDDIFRCVGQFNFSNGTDIEAEKVVATSARRFIFKNTGKHDYAVIPGGILEIPYTVKDEFNKSLSPLTFVSPKENDSPISFDRKYTLDNHFFPVGLPNESTTVDVAILGVRKVHFQFCLHTQVCPPGFVFNNKTGSCQCGNDEKDNYYKAIVNCKTKTFHALLDKHYWVGYIPEYSNDYQDLYFVPCFPPVCHYKETYLSRSYALSKEVCGDDKHGIMCGKCRANYTVFYHSRNYTCGKNTNCRYGPLFYIISELLPLFIVFLIVSIFDLSLTSGNVVGFLFFCQCLEETTTDISPTFSIIKAPYRFFYGIFNLNFFFTDRLSFCLWKTFHIQEVIAFKYVTIGFAFALVFFQILLLKSNRLMAFYKFRAFISTKKSVIHGVCAFLVMCYTNCTKTSFLLLKYVQPEGLNGKLGHIYTYYGGVPYFQENHTIYGAFALLFLLTITVLPLLILLLHPFLLQLLSICHLSEHWLVLKIMKVLCISRLVPFLDCFQSCYKDRYRLFAGLYFAYRLILHVHFITAKTYHDLLLGLQLLLLAFLGIHAVCQPYKRKLHNVLDSIVFINLSAINMLSLLALNEQLKSKKFQSTLVAIEAVQIALFYLPIMSFVFYMMWKFYSHCRSRPLYTSLDSNETDGGHSSPTSPRELYSSSNIVGDT